MGILNRILPQIFGPEYPIPRLPSYSEQLENDQRSVERALASRAANPIRCDTCSAREHEDVFFEGLATFHCPKCDRHGFMSVHPTRDMTLQCTGCANTVLFGSQIGY